MLGRLVVFAASTLTDQVQVTSVYVDSAMIVLKPETNQMITISCMRLFLE
jgi:hypothetical protein